MTLGIASSPQDSGGLVVAGLQSPLAGPFDLNLPSGSALAVTGASGSGKSLFLRMLADLEPCTGEVVLDGRRRADDPGHAWRRRAPYVAAESGWWAATPAEHFDPSRREDARRLAERLGIGREFFDSPVARLSTGERQRLALVRALVLASPLLLLDEPTGPLDVASVERVEVLLRERLTAGAVLIMSTHDPGQGARLGAQAWRIVDRQLERIA